MLNCFQHPDARFLLGICKLHEDRLVTFDGVPIMLPLYSGESTSSQCNVLLAQDCSERGLFSITSSFSSGRWTLRILTPNHKLELVPLREYTIVKVDGEEKRLRKSHPIRLNKLSEESRQATCDIIVRSGF